jgi:hypothetical protein
LFISAKKNKNKGDKIMIINLFDGMTENDMVYCAIRQIAENRYGDNAEEMLERVCDNPKTNGFWEALKK